jgi:N12 class adenine-specific DNA methylase
MTAIPFDTHEFYTELVESGLAEKTADALTKAVSKIEKAKLDELATKRDIEIVKKEIAETKADVIKTIVLVGGLQIAIITALLLKLSQIITH